MGLKLNATVAPGAGLASGISAHMHSPFISYDGIYYMQSYIHNKDYREWRKRSWMVEGTPPNFVSSSQWHQVVAGTPFTT
jgi:hypothetical protein